MNIATLLARSATEHRSRPAVYLGEQLVWRYEEWARRCSSLAASLRRRYRLEPGDRVALVMTNCPAFLEVLFGAWWAGLCAVPVNPRLHPRELAYILEDSGARLCFTSPDLYDPVSPLRGEVASLQQVIPVGVDEYLALFGEDHVPDPYPSRPNDVAWLFYTSGTTGRPKGAMLTHRNLLLMVLSYLADVDSVSPEDVWLHAAPMSHGSGLYGLPQVAKGSAQVVPESGHFEPREVFGLMERYPRLSLWAAPTMIKRLVESPYSSQADTTNLKTIVYGGAPMFVSDLLKALELFGPKLVQIYGQGESPMTITVLSKEHHAQRDHPRYLERLGSVGVPQTCVEVRVVDEKDKVLPPGEVGEVVVRGDVVMAGYWNKPEATAETLRGGWLHTGDLGVFDEDGFLTLKDRSKDLIISGGMNIYAREVEEVLLQHPGVREVAVVGQPDPEWGERVVAFVVARGEPPSPEELDAHCLAQLARFKRPRRYYFVDDLPKNNYGKVLKRELRERVAKGE